MSLPSGRRDGVGGRSSAARETLQDWYFFIRAEGYVLSRYPHLVFQQAANEPDRTAPARAARARMEAGSGTRPWLRSSTNRNRGQPA